MGDRVADAYQSKHTSEKHNCRIRSDRRRALSLPLAVLSNGERILRSHENLPGNLPNVQFDSVILRICAAARCCAQPAWELPTVRSHAACLCDKKCGDGASGSTSTSSGGREAVARSDGAAEGRGCPCAG